MDKDIRKLEQKDIPKQLFEIPQPPKNLWIIGDLPKEDLVYLCVVGSRKYTSYGKEACEKIIRGLKGYPIAIVSGFAIGIDTIAHKSAIEVGLKTLVFPGSGLSEKVIYPKTNVGFMREVVHSGGCLISEFPPDLKAAHWTFPMRNRLMAGMSKAVLIIEAQEKSGTLITARLALEYNKDVLVVPGQIFSQNSQGTNKLLHQGATLVSSSKDVLEALGFATEKENKEDTLSIYEDLSKEERKIFDLLLEPKERDVLIKESGLPISEANMILSVMEIKGLIKEELGEIRLI